MKKIINGKKYDTDTAEEIGYWNNGHFRNDFYYAEETLYKKKTGQFFLYCEGGAASNYSHKEGNMTIGGWELKLITEDEAKKWAEDYLTVEEYEGIFGEVKE